MLDSKNTPVLKGALMAKNKNNQDKKNKKSKSVQGVDVIDNVGAVSATEQTGLLAANPTALGAANADQIVNYKPKAKGKQ